VRKIPEHCPGCGARFTQGLGSRHPLYDQGKPQPRGQVTATGPIWGWDCWCPTCGWSGDISPDDKEPSKCG
jgi:hypothetical protein